MKSKVKSAAKAPAKAAHATKRAVRAEKPAAKKAATSGAAAKATKAAGTKTAQPAAKAAKPVKAKAEPAGKHESKAAPKLKKTAGMQEKLPARKKKRAANPETEAQPRDGGPVLDPIGDTTDGEGRTYLGELEGEPAATEQAVQSSAEVAAFRKETRIEASDTILGAGPGMEATQEARENAARNDAVETASAGGDARTTADLEAGATLVRTGGPERLERLQKILSQAGIASRRRAEEMITEGRVMVNGQVVTTLGSKADPERDHIRVDGKLLHGAERHRYFLLNKPKGFVTTVSDPEGRPTVMKFFEKMHERLYPVGRLDYQSEGLLLMTNDGELANLLTKAGSGVEKTYLVKVAGRPTEEELEKLRSGVTIERGEAGSGRVRTAPARVRQVRVGDNPWFEVVLIEGRNRELRKMFGAVGHFVEKIRRVGYGPLALDVEPGKMRELTPDEVKVLRLTAEGKMKPKRLHADRMLPKDAGMAAEKRFEKRGGRGGREFGRLDGGAFPRREGGDFGRGRSGGFDKRERKEFGTRASGGFRPRESGDSGGRGGAGFRPREGGGFAGRDKKPFAARGEQGQKREFRPRDGEFRGGTRGERRPFASRPAGEQQFGGEKRNFGGQPGKPFDLERGAGKPGEFRERPRFEGRKQFGGEKRPFGGGRPGAGPKGEFRSPGGDRPRFDRPKFDRPGFDRAKFDRTRADKPGFKKPEFDKPGFEKRSFDGPPAGKLRIEKVEFEKPSFDRPRFGKPESGGRPEGRREDAPRKPFRPEGDRPGGFKRPGNPSGARPGGAGRPKTGFGGRPGGFGKTNRPGGFKRPNKPGGGGRSSPRFGGGRPGGR